MGQRIAYFAPTYKCYRGMERDSTVLYPVTYKKDVQQISCKPLTGGIIDFWSLDNIDSARGRKYHELLVDDAPQLPHLLNAGRHHLGHC
jgi:hypothetical protein